MGRSWPHTTQTDSTQWVRTSPATGRPSGGGEGEGWLRCRSIEGFLLGVGPRPAPPGVPPLYRISQLALAVAAEALAGRPPPATRRVHHPVRRHYGNVVLARQAAEMLQLGRGQLTAEIDRRPPVVALGLVRHDFELPTGDVSNPAATCRKVSHGPRMEPSAESEGL
jgi:hypothetical protein